MELASITFWQVAILFILIFTGVLCVKTRIFPSEAKTVLSNMLVYLIMPAMAINSYIADYDPETGKYITRICVQYHTYLYRPSLDVSV